MIDTRIENQPLESRLQEALACNPYFPRPNIRVEAAAGRVTLKGTVSSYFHKQMAQETLRRVDGVEMIENLLEVSWK
jgi:osmotically-inducible protein OsmY